MKLEYKGYIVTTKPGDPRSIIIKNAKQGGSLPVRLAGVYTNSVLAREAIDLYALTSKPVKE